MIRFLIGLIFGVILGALAVIIFAIVPRNSLVFTPSLTAGQAVVHLTIDEPYLNQQLAAILATQPEFANANPQLDVQAPNVAMLTVSMDMGGNTISVRPTLTIQFHVENGQVRTQVVGINVGRLNVPDAVIRPQLEQLERTLDQQINSAVASGLAGTGLRVVSVGATDTGLVVDLGQ